MALFPPDKTRVTAVRTDVLKLQHILRKAVLQKDPLPLLSDLGNPAAELPFFRPIPGEHRLRRPHGLLPYRPVQLLKPRGPSVGPLLALGELPVAL